MTRSLFLHLFKWALLSIVLLGFTPLCADDTTINIQTVTPPPITDPAKVAEHYREVLTQPQFQDVDESPVGLRLEDWLSQWFKQLGKRIGDFQYASRMPAFESFLMTMLVTFAIAILFYLLMRLTRRRSEIEPKTEAWMTGSNTFRPPEFYDLEIEQAIQKRDWHMAWLAAWRQFLSRLEHRQLVEADRSRTNHEYLAQLRTKSLPASGSALLHGMVNAYDRFIYGRKEIGEPDWNHFHQQIGEAALLLHLVDKPKNSQVNGSAS
jgi:hypothetical protein